MSKVLIVEDETQIAKMYQFKLELSGYDVHSAVNGKLGLELAEMWQPDIILLDLMMPEMNGVEMLEKVRASAWGSNVKVIVLTNISKSEAPSDLRFLNVDRYIVKAHYTPSQVVQVVSEVLSSDSQLKK
jgi:DNA-binding response OmpR family regulator